MNRNKHRPGEVTTFVPYSHDVIPAGVTSYTRAE